MRNIFAAVSLATLCIVLLTLGLSAQSDLPDFPDLLDTPRRVQVTIPPFEPPTGTVITVTTTSDDLEDNGNCTLREAIQAANTDTAVDGCPAGDGEDLVLVPAGVYTLTLAGASEDDNLTGDLDVRSSMVISGAGADLTQIDANSIDRVLHLHVETKVEVRGITLTNGEPAYGESGGGLNSLGVMTLTSSVISHNFAGNSIIFSRPPAPKSAIYAGNGGGIANQGNMVLIDSMVVENRGSREEIETNRYSQGGAGGGIYNSGWLSVIDSHTLSNTSGNGGDYGSEYGSGGDGGGIFSSGYLYILDSVIAANRTGYGGWLSKGPNANGNGGGIATTGVVTIVNSQLHANIGGGLFNLGSTWLIASEISGNQNSNNLVWTDERILIGSGGGIANYGLLVMSNCTVSNNRSADGIMYYIVGVPGRDGGGIFNSGDLFLENCTITRNMAGKPPDQNRCQWFCQPGTDGCSSSCDAGSGGGLANEGSLSMYNTIIAQNYVFDNGIGADCIGEINSHGYNLVGAPINCNLTGLTHQDLYYQNAWLAPLDDNGGPTPTHALLPQSPALNNGSCTTFDSTPITEDQRGEPRPQGEGCDIGAYESDLEYVPPEDLFLPVIERHE